MPLEQLLLYLTIASAFTGSLWLYEAGPIHVFPFRMLLIVMWLLFLSSIFFLNNGRLDLSHVKVKMHLYFFVIWLAYASLSIIWAADKLEALRNISFLFIGCSIIFFLIFYFRKLNYLKWLYWLWLFIFIVLIPIGIWEVITGNHLTASGLYAEIRPDLIYAPTTVFYNQNDFATYIALTLPMLIASMRNYPKSANRILFALVFIAGLFLLISTTSRSCLVALLLGLSFWFLFLLKLKGKCKTLAIATIMLVLIISAFPDQTMETIDIVTNQIHSLSSLRSHEDDESIDIRQNLIRNALYFTAESAGVGVGAGNAEFYMERFKIYPVGYVTNVHNWWVEILLNYGVFIFAGYVILYVTILLNLWRAYKRVIDRTEKMICEALLVGMVIFFVASVSSSSIIAFSPQWIFFGFILAFLNYTRITNAARNSKCTS